MRIIDRILAVLLVISLVLGHWGRLDIAPGITLYLFDAVTVAVFARLILDGRLRSQIPLTRLFSYIVIFLLALAVSLAVNFWRVTLSEFSHSALYLLRLAGYACFYFWGALLLNRRSGILLLGAFGTFFSLAGFFQLAILPDMRLFSFLGYDPHYYRLVSSYFDPNFAAIILVLTFILILSAGEVIKIRRRLFAAAIVFLALVFTYSRSGYLALFSALAFHAVMTRRYWVVLIAGAVLALFTAIPKANYVSLDIFRTVTVASRLNNLREGLAVFMESPVFGIGFNTLRYTVSPPASRETVIVSRALSGFDSSLVFLMATAGVVGLFCYGLLIYRVIKPKGTGLDRENRLILIPSLVAVLMHSFAVNSLFYPPVVIWLFLLFSFPEES